jgi:hypothetical protein
MPDSSPPELISGPRKRKAPPVDPDNSETVRLELISQNKKKRIAKKDPRDAKSVGKTAKRTVNQPVVVTKPVEKITRRASVEVVVDVDDIQPAINRVQPRNPKNIIESDQDDQDDDEVEVTVPKGSSSKRSSCSENLSADEESGEEAEESDEAELSENLFYL